MITVRAAAERAFGKIPEGATVHIGCCRMTPETYTEEGRQVRGQLVEIVWTCSPALNHVPLNYVGQWNGHALSGGVLGPDISNEPCTPFFRTIFGEAFDLAVTELEEEESDPSELEDAVDSLIETLKTRRSMYLDDVGGYPTDSLLNNLAKADLLTIEILEAARKPKTT